jgi:hypothetical protein
VKRFVGGGDGQRLVKRSHAQPFGQRFDEERPAARGFFVAVFAAAIV